MQKLFAIFTKTIACIISLFILALLIIYFSFTYTQDPRNASTIKAPFIWLGYKIIYDEHEDKAMSNWDEQTKAYFTYAQNIAGDLPLKKNKEDFEKKIYEIFGKKYEQPQNIFELYYFSKKINFDYLNNNLISTVNTKLETQLMYAALIKALAHQYDFNINMTDIVNHVTTSDIQNKFAPGHGIFELNQVLLEKSEKNYIDSSAALFDTLHLGIDSQDLRSQDSQTILNQFFLENFECKKELQEPDLSFSFLGMVIKECYKHTNTAQLILNKYYNRHRLIDDESKVFDKMKIIMIDEHLSEYINQMSNKNLYARDLANCTVYWHSMSAKMEYLSIQNHDSNASRQAYFFGKTADKFAIATRKALGSDRSKYWTENDAYFISLKIGNSGADNKLNEFNQYNCSLDPSELDI